MHEKYYLWSIKSLKIIRNMETMFVPLAMIVPVEKKPTKRKIGILDGKVKIEFKDDFEMTTEELLEMQLKNFY